MSTGAIVTPTNLRAVRAAESAVRLMRQLGYSADALPYDARGELEIDADAQRLRSSSSLSRGYGIVVAEMAEPLGPARRLGRRLLERFHDRPLALIGRRNGASGWEEFTLVRPRLIAGRGGAVTVARLTVDRLAPTRHDATVVGALAWRVGSDAENHRAIDAAFDVERVTRRFYLGLADHHRAIESAVVDLTGRDAGLSADVERIGGPWRVALRVLTQVLFCYFLQRKRLMGGERDWLSQRFRLARGHGRADTYYTEVMEPAFYEALGRPEAEREAAWRESGLPFLDGGLFERQIGRSLPLPGALFSTDEGLLGFLDGWTFTVAEEMADDAEVAVDPEMLGKVFENLIGDEEARRQGTVYTPRPVVQFMCREALVPYLSARAGLDEGDARTLVADDDPARLETALAGPGRADAVDAAARDIRVIDPAVGSGAFPLGMLGELVRLRTLCHRRLFGDEPDTETVRAWKLHAIERCLYGIDINPTAIELCRLRMWLALIVDLPPGREPDPLPNLEYRTVCAPSLSDFLAGVSFQSTRGGLHDLGFDRADASELAALRRRFFGTSDPAEKAALRAEIRDHEDDVLGGMFRRAGRAAEERARESRKAADRSAGERALIDVAALKERFQSPDRVFPLFMPGFHAPEVFGPETAERGWDVAIMNPPYVSRKEARQRLDATALDDLAAHYGRTFDLMIHFAFRALELVRPGGVLSMIFNDSIFTSADADELRRALCGTPYQDRAGAVRVAARTRCFEGKAVNGGVVVAVRGGEPERLRWVENYKRPTRDLLAASAPGTVTPGESELFEVPASELMRLPHRPLFRPSGPARRALALFERCAFWSEFARWEAPDRHGADWPMLSETRRLARWKERARAEGRLDALRPSEDFVLLGLVVGGGVGLQTGDDRRFLAAIEGTDEGDRAVAMAERLENLLPAGPRGEYEAARARGLARPEALLELTLRHNEDELGWTKGGLVRTVPRSAVRTTRLAAGEVRSGIASGPAFVPFEKGDDSDGGLGARWRRENPLAIDWSVPAVALLRERASGADSHRRPRIQNEQLWGQGGVTWNRVASFLRVREVPEGAIFSDMAPTISPEVAWLSAPALTTLLNSDAADFVIRTFLGSRMHVEIGHLRRLPVPVLTDAQGSELDALGREALAAKEALDRGTGSRAELRRVEEEIDARVRALYGFRPDDELWVVR